jgi:mannose-6-phosphate isomerase-like protein (cupin superfamily)
MRISILATTFMLLTSISWAQQPGAAADNAAAMKLFGSSVEIATLIVKAARERKPNQPNFVQPVLRLAPYTLNLEYRVGGLTAPASVHEHEAELFFVVNGGGTAVTGGKLKEETRGNGGNLSGLGIEGGKSQVIRQGDVLFVPENTPHWFDADGVLVLLSLHVPRPVTP